VARSDQDEYVEFVSARMVALRRTARFLCGDWDRGDDVVQRTLTDLYANWRKVKRADSPDAYLRTMLVRRFLDERRRRWSSVRLVEETPDLPDTGQLDVTTRMDVRAALARLAPRQRAVIVLRYYCDLSVAQTAEALGCGEGTVKSQTARALETLRGHLSVEGVGHRA
jgi:RNA polymerase sigma-70 factor (sigma-E family)